MGATRQFCTFYLDGRMFGVESQQIQEVMRLVEITEVPLAPRAIGGLMNLRGQIVAAIDLRRRLEFAPRAGENMPMCVVARSTEGAVSLLVDAIGDVVEVDEETFEQPPETLEERLRSVILGVHKLDRELLHVLDAERICVLEDLVANGTPAN
jgi:purine-binding chemotaxis protein CheW